MNTPALLYTIALTAGWTWLFIVLVCPKSIARRHFRYWANRLLWFIPEKNSL